MWDVLQPISDNPNRVVFRMIIDHQNVYLIRNGLLFQRADTGHRIVRGFVVQDKRSNGRKMGDKVEGKSVLY